MQTPLGHQAKAISQLLSYLSYLLALSIRAKDQDLESLMAIN